MKLTVLICTFNGAERLAEVVRYLAMQDHLPRNAWELIIVDNASTDGTLAVLSRITADFPACVRLLTEPSLGKANALRTGFREAQGEFFCIVDDDNLLQSDYLAKGVEFLEAHIDVALIGGRTLPKFPEGITLPTGFDNRYAPFLACNDKGESLLWNDKPPGAGQMGRSYVMRGIYEQIGTHLEDRVGEGVGCSEDLEKGFICARLGWRTAYVPELKLHHVMTARRLTESYIDELSCAAISTGPWLKLVSGREPNSIRWQAVQCVRDLCRSFKYVLLSILPARLNAKLSRASYWQRFYASRAKAYFQLIVNRPKIDIMLNAIKNAPAELRPPSLKVRCD